MVKDTRFLLALNKNEKDLYILHREYPRCLILVEKEVTPVNFVVLDFFETDENQEDSINILTSDEFKKDLREYFVSQSFSKEEFN